MALFAVDSSGKVRKNLPCVSCDLSKNSRLQCNKMPGEGNRSSPQFLFSGYAPGDEDDAFKRPMTGANGRLFREMVALAGIDLREQFTTNCIRCAPFDKEPQKKHWQACQKHFLRDLEEIKPQAIVALGARAFFFLTGYTHVRRFKRTAAPCLLDPDIPVYVVNQPAAVFHAETPAEKDKLKTEIIADFMWLREKAEAGKLRGFLSIEDDADYKIAHTLDDVRAFLAEFDDIEEVCADYETCDKDFNGAVRPYHPDSRICLVGLSARPKHARAIPVHALGDSTYSWWTKDEESEVVRLLSDFHRKKKFFGHNFNQFDQWWARYEFKVPYLDVTYDTMYAAYLIDPERGGHGVEELALRYANMPPWKPEEINRLMKDTKKLGIYCCRDVDATLRVREALEQALTPKQRELHKTMLQLGREFMDLSDRGVHISQENLKKYGGYIQEKLKLHRQTLYSYPEIKQFKMAEQVTFNPNSNAHLANLMENYLHLPRVEETATGGYSVGAKTRSEYLHVPVIDTVDKILKLQKLKSNYWEPIVELTKDRPTIHSNILLHATVTGRIASRSPNLNVQPRADTIEKTGIEDPDVAKSIFVPGEGKRCLLQVDESQAELRVLASRSGDPALIEVFKRGGDVHKATAAKVNNIPESEVTKGMRSQSKKVAFGIVYGESEKSIVRGFVDVARKQARDDGRPFTRADEAEAASRGQEFIAKHKQVHPYVWKYGFDQEKIVARQGYQETPTGRRRYYPKLDNEAKRQLRNFEIQSLASDLVFYALLRAMRRIRAAGLDAYLVMSIYDSVILDVLMEHLWLVAAIVKEEMETFDFPWLTVPMVADVEAGMDWGHMKALDVKNRKVVSK